MTDLPAAGYISDNARTEGEGKQFFEDLRSLHEEGMGGDALIELTIATGVVTATRAAHTIDTEADSASDDLNNILQTNTPDGRILEIRIAASGRTVVVKHASGGAGEIILADAVDFTMDDIDLWLVLRRVGTQWLETDRAYGADRVAQRTFDGSAGLIDINAFTNTQRWSKGADLASAATLVIGTDGNYFDVTGVIGVTGMTIAAGTLFMLQFDGAVPITNSASLAIQGGADYTTAVGDHALCWATAADTVKMFIFRAAQQPGQHVVQTVNVMTGAHATGATPIPLDDTIPQQSTDGDSYMTLAVIPKNTSNILKIDVVFNGSISVAQVLSIALYQDSTEDALAAIRSTIPTLNDRVAISFIFYMAAGTTSSTTFKVFAGRSTGSGTVNFNGSGGARIFGGVMASSITITEYAA